MAKKKSDYRLDPPIPAVLPDRDALLRAIVDADEGDRLPYLVYADWQDEHDQPEHAELIRVMCAVEDNRTRDKAAEKKRLLARVKELLATPPLAAVKRLYPNTYRYRCGFPHPAWLELAGDSPSHSQRTALGDGRLDASLFVPFDKIAQLTLAARERWLGPTLLSDLAAQAWLPRVTELEFVETTVEAGGLAALAAADLSGLLGVSLHDCRAGPGQWTGLINSPTAPNLRRLSLHTRSRPEFVRLLREILCVPSAARFRELYLHDWSVTERAAKVLLDSTYLSGVTRISTFAELPPATVAALKEKFGRAFR